MSCLGFETSALFDSLWCRSNSYSSCHMCHTSYWGCPPGPWMLKAWWFYLWFNSTSSHGQPLLATITIVVTFHLHTGWHILHKQPIAKEFSHGSLRSSLIFYSRCFRTKLFHGYERFFLICLHSETRCVNGPWCCSCTSQTNFPSIAYACNCHSSLQWNNTQSWDFPSQLDPSRKVMDVDTRAVFTIIHQANCSSLVVLIQDALLVC